MAVFEFQGEIRDLIIKNLNDGYLATGRYAPDERAVSPQGVMSMAVAGTAAGTTTLSSVLAPTLYMATANPASLMPIGAGVGDAVMGAGGIVGHAPFIPVAASMPVLAPLMAVLVLNTAMTMQQFRQVNEKLDSIKRALDAAAARTEATHVGELVAASKVVDEINEQYEQAGSFSVDMLVRLAIAERDVRRLAERYSYLVKSQEFTDINDVADVQQLNYDAHSAILASFLDLRIAHLRVGVDLQDHPASMTIATRRLKATVEGNITLWEFLLHRSEDMRKAMENVREHFDDQNWVAKHLPGFAGGKGHSQALKLSAMKDGYVAILESEKAIMEGFSALIQSSKETLNQLEAPATDAENSPTLVCWDDENGKHSFATDAIKIN